jgi:hypothetical protein
MTQQSPTTVPLPLPRVLDPWQKSTGCAWHKNRTVCKIHSTCVGKCADTDNSSSSAAANGCAVGYASTVRDAPTKSAPAEQPQWADLY